MALKTQGWNDEDIRQRTGHSTVTILVDNYMHAVKSEADEIAELKRKAESTAAEEWSMENNITYQEYEIIRLIISSYLLHG